MSSGKPPLTDLRRLKDLLSRHGLAPKKGLGQHWLVSSRVVDAVVAECAGAGGILEIGPGAGVLTERLMAIAPTIAIDLDPRTGPVLAETAPRAEWRHQDVLDANLSDLSDELRGPKVAVGNLPYYISTAILRKFAEKPALFDRLVFMMQAEVADKLLAPVGDSSRSGLSVAMQRLFSITRVCSVSRGAFYPPPKVESSVLSLKPTGKAWAPLSEQFLFAGFKQPRKTVFNNLAAAYTREEAAAALADSAIDPALRPAALSEDQWVRLAERLHSPTS